MNNVHGIINNLEQNISKLSGEEAEAYLLQSMAEVYRSDLFTFAKYGLGYSEMTWKTHGELITVLEGPSRRKVVCFPRGGFKSSIASVSYPMWLLINNPNLRILLDGEVFGNSKNFLREIKGHMKSTHIESLFGNFEGPQWTESYITIDQRKKIKKEPTIICGGVGTTRVGQHYDVIIGDDYNSPANSDTPEKCQKVINHYKYNISILEPDGIYVIIGTRYSEDDLIGWILRNELGLKQLSEGKFDEILGPRGLIK